MPWKGSLSQLPLNSAKAKLLSVKPHASASWMQLKTWRPQKRTEQGGQGCLALALAMESVEGNQPPAQALQALRTVALGTGTRAVLKGHSQSVEAVAFSPDAKIAFSGSRTQMDAAGTCQAGELILWDIDSLKESHRWSGHSGWVTVVAVSQDGQTLISGAEDGSLILWNRNGAQIGQLVGH